MRARATLFIAASALMAALVLGLYLARDDTPRAPAGEHATSVRIDATRSASPATNDDATRVAADAGVDESAAPEQIGGELDVLYSGTGSPVAGATVWWWPTSAVDESELHAWLRRSEIEQHLASAAEARTDGEGRVRLPNLDRGGLAVAATGELWGSAFFAPAADAVRSLVVTPNLDVTVRVADADGRPVGGVLVALRERRLDACFDHLTARTTAEGEAVLRHAHRTFGAQPEPNASFLVAVDGLFDPPLERAIDADTAGEPITFALEPTGSCAIVMVDANDQPLGGALEARLRLADADGPAATLESRTGEGVVFERVEIGHALLVAITREASGATAEFRGLGPRVAGERVELRVPVAAGSTVLRGRVVDATGRPTADLAMRARIARDGDRATDEVGPLRTAPDGRFVLEVAPPAASEDGRLELVQISGDGIELAIARRDLPRELRAGAYELGALALVELPVVAAGRVVDREGRPIAHAAIEAAPRAVDDVEKVEGPRCLTVHSEADGSFTIRGELACDELTLSARAHDLVGETVAIRRGARDATLVLEPAAALEGAVLLDPSLGNAVVLVEARAQTGESTRDPALVVPLGGDGRFALSGLRPGPYAVSVVYAATATELASIAHVQLTGGSARRDARLDPLDLRGSHRLIELEPVDDRGTPVAAARAFSRASDRPDAAWTYSARPSGPLQLLSDGHPLDVVIAAPGFQRCELDRVDASRQVVLRRAARVRLELPRDIAVPALPLRLSAVLTPCAAGPSCGFVDAIDVDFNSRGEAVCEVANVGALRIELALTRRGSGTSAALAIDSALPRVIRVEDHAEEQVFQIALDPESRERARQAFDDATFDY